ncbi:hypothetical protein [Micromonospora sp. NPDC049891]|uniref:hypothetical protein n=1 Tax=Micromonospora sp. NPDC049891 TaxID=3155655 RepID=UPI0033CA9D13
MSPQANSNTPSAVIRRVRRRNDRLHVTYADGRKVDVPAAVNSRYESQVSYRFEQGACRADRVS